jgi:hypothetical protein
MRKKAAIELSANFLVVIILSIVILVGSVYLLTTVVGKARELSAMTQDDLDKRIESLQCTDLVCFAVNYKQIERGKFEVFGLKVFNNGQTQGEDFKLTVNQTSPLAPQLNWQPKTYEFRARLNDEARIGVGIEVPKNASSGIYIFNANVYKDNSIYGNTIQFRVEVP